MVGDYPGLFAGMLGNHLPASVGKLVHVGDERVAGELTAQLAGTRGHGAGGAGGIGPAVTGGPESEDDVGEVVYERLLFPDVGVADDVRFDADRVEHALDVVEPVGLVGAGGETYGAAGVPAG